MHGEVTLDMMSTPLSQQPMASGLPLDMVQPVSQTGMTNVHLDMMAEHIQQAVAAGQPPAQVYNIAHGLEDSVHGARDR